ncbi:MAG TPA: tyrosine-type recombinase/integrase, partial [Micromonosporaceae bacterium]|nr:tyrosine-type recombinase/integrase [Micromonosporaceae bacterium]
TGLRISELTGLTRADLHLGAGAHVSCHGKGRKDRITPLTRGTIAVLRNWLDEHHGDDPGAPLFPTRRGTPLSRDAIEHRLAHYTIQAATNCASLHGKTVTAHVLRHYVDGRVMWPEAASPLVAEPRGLVPVT